MDHLENCGALEKEIGRFADLLNVAEPQLLIPSCPGWTATDLGGHLGSVHRWAEHLVRILAPVRISSEDMDLDNGPVTPEWIRDGGSRLVSTLRSSFPDEAMWAWGIDQHVRFWSRRQLHETLVHRMDIDLALGHSPGAEPEIAVDAIDEFFENLASAVRFSPNVRELRGVGERLRMHVSDREKSWTLALVPDGYELCDDAASVDAELKAPATKLFLILYRRIPLESPEAFTFGDTKLIDFWLAHSALQ